MARHRHIPKDHDHEYEEFPTTAGLIRMICGSCGHVGIGLVEDTDTSLGPEEARSILEALASARSYTMPEPVA